MPKITTLTNDRSDSHSQLDSLLTQFRNKAKESPEFAVKLIAEDDGTTTLLATILGKQPTEPAVE